MEISEFQKLMKEKIGVEDREMGSLFLFSVLVEEIGELAKAIRCKNEELIGEELADVVFCVTSLANICNQELEPVLIQKYVKRKLSDISKDWIDVKWKQQAGA